MPWLGLWLVLMLELGGSWSLRGVVGDGLVRGVFHASYVASTATLGKMIIKYIELWNKYRNLN